MSAGLWVLIVALAAATAFGLVRAARDGRFRPARGSSLVPATPPATATGAAGEPTAAGAATESAVPLLGPADLGAELGERATLVQFSTAFCAPCRATRQVLGDVAGRVPGVAHVEVDAEQQLALVRRLGILRTPTTLILDPAGAEVTRAAGAPTRAAVLGTLHHRLGIDSRDPSSEEAPR